MHDTTERPVTPDGYYDELGFTPTLTSAFADSLPTAKVQKPVADDEASLPETIDSASDAGFSTASTVDDDELYPPQEIDESFVDLGEINADHGRDDASSPRKMKTPILDFTCGFAHVMNANTDDIGKDSQITITQNNAHCNSSPGEPIDNKQPTFAAEDVKDAWKSTSKKDHSATYLSVLRNLAKKPASWPAMLLVFLLLMINLINARSKSAMIPPMAPAEERALRCTALAELAPFSDSTAALLESYSCDSLLAYPSATSDMNGVKSTTLTYPTAVSVHVVHSDQLFVSIPRNTSTNSYPSNIQVSVLKHASLLKVIAATSLIDGLFHVQLDPSEASGYVIVHVLATAEPTMSEYVKVDLGSRLFKRQTYNKAASIVQQEVQREIHEVQSAAEVYRKGIVSGFRSQHRLVLQKAADLKATTLLTFQEGSDRIRQVVHDTARIPGSIARPAVGACTEAAKKARQRLGTAINAGKSQALQLKRQVQHFVPYKTTVPQDFQRAKTNLLAIRKHLLNRAPVVVAEESVEHGSDLLTARIKAALKVASLQEAFQGLTERLTAIDLQDSWAKVRTRLPSSLQADTESSDRNQ